MFLMRTYEQLSKVQINVLLFQLFVTIFTFCKAFWRCSFIYPHLKAVLDYLSVAWSVVWKLRKRGARVCTVIFWVGRVWNILWYLCLRCLYIRNGGGLTFQGELSIDQSVMSQRWCGPACLPACLPLSLSPLIRFSVLSLETETELKLWDREVPSHDRSKWSQKGVHRWCREGWDLRCAG